MLNLTNKIDNKDILVNMGGFTLSPLPELFIGSIGLGRQDMNFVFSTIEESQRKVLTSLEIVAKSIFEDYKSDEELTIFTSLDGDDYLWQ